MEDMIDPVPLASLVDEEETEITGVLLVAAMLVSTVDMVVTTLSVYEIMLFPLVSKGAAEIAGVLVAVMLVSTMDMVVTMLPVGEITLFPLVSEEAAEMT